MGERRWEWWESKVKSSANIGGKPQSKIDKSRKSRLRLLVRAQGNCQKKPLKESELVPPEEWTLAAKRG